MIDGRKDNDLREDSRRKCRVLGVWRGELRNGNVTEDSPQGNTEQDKAHHRAHHRVHRVHGVLRRNIIRYQSIKFYSVYPVYSVVSVVRSVGDQVDCPQFGFVTAAVQVGQFDVERITVRFEGRLTYFHVESVRE